ncbi:unnamed protein product [Mycena citricolor]|uniref:Alcohol acetyltransferase n=1 Tax=Mycena citricolor TaxID=2018698 RepID=A0AAD2JVY6_9AGAR|nr:unnamed protein product [Mycena citricolor]
MEAPILQRLDSTASDATLVSSPIRHEAVERPLGETEVSYFLPSRASGVNDMYLHLGLRANPEIFDRSRVSAAWAMLRLKHPLVASTVKMNDYHDIKFVYNPPASVTDAIESANECLEYRTQGKDDLIDSYLNGPRTLSSERLSYLIISEPEQDESEDGTRNFDLLVCAAHYIGDGMALHQFSNELFTLLGEGRSAEDLQFLLTEEWHTKWGASAKAADTSSTLPISLEDRLPPRPEGKFFRAASQVDFQTSESRLMGGHAFPRRSGGERKTVVPTVSFDADKTKAMLKKCKAQGVSISAALFSLMNVAWAKTRGDKWELPMMMYSALNLRPVLTASKVQNETYWYLAIGYFNVVLPTFMPIENAEVTEKLFWHRARAAKTQSTKAAKNPLLASRSYEMANERGKRARRFAKEDDEKEAGTWQAPPPKPASAEPAAPKQAPSTALIGLSLLGNLDGVYKHATYPSIKLHTLTTGSRQRAGGMLLFGYTFAGKMWISLGYDKAGFDETVDTFWGHVLSSVDTLFA